MLLTTIKYTRSRRGPVPQGCDCKATVVGSISMRGNELLFINICISSLWYKAKIPSLISATQNAMPRIIGERSVLTLGYLCISYFVRGIA